MARDCRQDQDRPILVAGVGNPHRGDDGVGPWVARRLRDRLPPSIAEVLEVGGDLLGLLEDWAGAGAVLLIDATWSGGPPGKVWRFEASHSPVPAQAFGYSTHSLGVAQTIELSRALGTLPPVVLVYGVEGESFEPDRGLSPRVESAAIMLVEEVAGMVRTLALTSHSSSLPLVEQSGVMKQDA